VRRLDEDCAAFTAGCPLALDIVLSTLGRRGLDRLLCLTRDALTEQEDINIDTTLLKHLLEVEQVVPGVLAEHTWAVIDVVEVVFAAITISDTCLTVIEPGVAVLSKIAETAKSGCIEAAMENVWLASILRQAMDIRGTSAGHDSKPLDRLFHGLLRNTIDQSIGGMVVRTLMRYPVFTPLVTSVLLRLQTIIDEDNATIISKKVELGFNPYSFGYTAFERAFAAHVKLLTRATMCNWEATNGQKFMKTRHHSKIRQLIVYRACVKRNDKIKKFRELIADSKKSDKAMVTEIQRLNQLNAAAVNGSSKKGFQTLKERRLFEETRAFFQEGLLNNLTENECFQAGRNAWTCFALQIIYSSMPAAAQGGVTGYSFLYPYTDNYLDDVKVSFEDKIYFQHVFEKRLKGKATFGDVPEFAAGQKAFTSVNQIEEQWDRDAYREAYLSLLAINNAQTWSLYQHCTNRVDPPTYKELYEATVYKGGASVLADAFMVYGSCTVALQAFAYGLGFSLQVVDDLQDVEEDIKNFQETMYTVAYESRNTEFTTILTRRLLNFIKKVCDSARFTSNFVDENLNKILLTITTNIVLKAIARSPVLFPQKFRQEWAPLAPLPASCMKKLHSLRHLFQLTLNNEI
jgi:hypothetical protein